MVVVGEPWMMGGRFPAPPVVPDSPPHAASTSGANKKTMCVARIRMFGPVLTNSYRSESRQLRNDGSSALYAGITAGNSAI